MDKADSRRNVVVDPKTIELIERVVYDEARGEGPEGRNAVRAVIYNRLAANRRDFGGNTVLGVLNAPKQFQGVMEKGKGDVRRLTIPEDVRENYMQEHVAFVRGGEDPTNGATFFQNPGAAKNPYSADGGTQIGKHVFYDNYRGNKVEVPEFAVALRGYGKSKPTPEATGKATGEVTGEVTTQAPQRKIVDAAKEGAQIGIERAASAAIPDFLRTLNPPQKSLAQGSTPVRAPNPRATAVPEQPLAAPQGAQRQSGIQRIERTSELNPIRMHKGGYIAAAKPTLSSEEEQQFQQWIKNTGWYKEFKDQYGEEPQIDTPEYDYRAAWKAGIEPERDPYDNNRYHWASSDSSGAMLKSEDHPTAWKEYFMRDTGQNPDALGVASPEQAEEYFKSLDAPKMAKGGLIENEDDMKLNKFACGGMMAPDTIVGYEEESGNEIPFGSTASEVADDVPVMMSEGEVVLPGDVVRWHGLKHIMEMRQEAKMGLMAMAMEGQIQTYGEDAEGGEEEETLYETPEGNEVDIAQHEVIEEEMEYGDDEDLDYSTDMEDLVGDEELIVVIRKDPAAFKSNKY